MYNASIKMILPKLVLAAISYSFSHACYAVNYYYPAGNLTAAVAPQTLASGDTLNINSSTFQTTNSAAYTVNPVRNATINTQAGSTISYAGSNRNASTIFFSATAATTQTYNLSGTISAGTGSNAISFSNTNSSSSTININLYNAVINGNISSLGLTDVNTYIIGTPQINGNITGTGIGTPPEFPNVIMGQISVGDDSVGTRYPGSSFVTHGTVNYEVLNISSGSSFTLNHASTITQIHSASTKVSLTINQPLIGYIIALSQAVCNVTISANLNMKTNYGGEPIVDVYNLFVTKPIYVTTTSGFVVFAVENLYTSVMNDQLNYGQLNLSLNSGILFIPSISASYTGGYLAGGSYTLLSSDVANTSTPTIGSLPANTMFLRFDRPTITSKAITINITRTPFQAIATDPTAQDIGSSLEYIGSHNPSASDMTVLNILETANSATQLNNYLLQLAPLASAATQSLNVQNLSIRQPMTRLAEARSYSSGDQKFVDNVWIRPFANSVTQHTINSINGYTANTAGLALGADKEINEDVSLGIGASYAYARIADKIHASSHTYLNAYQVMVYGSNIFGSDESWYSDWVGAIAHNTYDGNRKITLPSYNSTATASYNNNNYSALGVVGKNYANGRCRFMPELSAQYSYLGNFSYTEIGAPGANLIVNKEGTNIIQLGAWLRTSALFDFQASDLIPEAYIAGLYNVLDTKKDLGFQFVDGGAQILSNMGPNNAAARLGCAFTYTASNRLDLKLNFDVELQNEYTDYSAYLNLRYLF